MDSKSQKNPPKPQKSPPTPLHLFLFLFTISLLTTTTTPYTTNPEITLYTQHCNHIVPETPLYPTTTTTPLTGQFLRLSSAFYAGFNNILNQTSDSPKSLSFLPYNTHKTIVDGIYKIHCKLTFKGPRSFAVSAGHFGRHLRFQVRGPRIPVRRGVVSFGLSGFWSESTGKLCMVGSGSGYVNAGNFMPFNVVLKLNYPKIGNLSVVDSLVTGVLESLDDKNSSLSYFEPVSILGLAMFNENYKYTLIDKGNGNGCLSGENIGEYLSFKDLQQGMCSVFGRYTDRYELDYGSDCGNVSCSILGGGGGGGGGGVGYLPGSMLFRSVRCVDKRKIQMLLGFRNTSLIGGGYFPFDPNTTLIAEGEWDEKKNQLCAVACRIMNFTDSLSNAFVGDCSIRLSLRFHAVLSLRNRSLIVGQIWSNKTMNDSGYFGKVGFQSSREYFVLGLKYNYTLTNNVTKSCAKMKTAKGKGKTYPTANSYDMRFAISVRNSKGKVAWGSANPQFVGDQLYQHLPFSWSMVWQNGSAVQLSNSHSSQLNVSYKLSFMPSPDFKLDSVTPPTKEVEIAAEGMYDRDTGVLCMIGCRSIDHLILKNDSQDCDIVISIQFSPLNAKGSHHVKGTIESTRKNSDPLYFEILELSSNSIYTSQAVASIWRMDLEITMVLISNTLACVFVGLQLFHVNKHPDVLSVISVVMLVVLTLGHMIPLLLNFDAMFKGNRSQQNVFLGSGGWLEVNEIIVRVVTMVAFLLQFRLLQLTWSARKGDENRKDLWVSEKKVLYVALPLYICGGLISWFVHHFITSQQSPFLRGKGYVVYPNKQHWYQQRSLWGDLRSYGGLVLDGFLLPQIVFNIFFNSREQALSASFYMGATLVRLLPHAYDLYRAHSSTWYRDMSYIYANHKMDLYSTAWDIIIPCGGLLFAVLIFLQQRFGGWCILPKRFRESSVYEKVPVVSSEELQERPVHKNFNTL